jgi:hypothetical protein
MIKTIEVHEEHGESLLEGILEITFGLEHVVAEFFWNAVFVLVTFALTRSIALRKAHKYIDDKHGVEHEEGY